MGNPHQVSSRDIQAEQVRSQQAQQKQQQAAQQSSKPKQAPRSGSLPPAYQVAWFDEDAAGGAAVFLARIGAFLLWFVSLAGSIVPAQLGLTETVNGWTWRDLWPPDYVWLAAAITFQLVITLFQWGAMAMTRKAWEYGDIAAALKWIIGYLFCLGLSVVPSWLTGWGLGQEALTVIFFGNATAAGVILGIALTFADVIPEWSAVKRRKKPKKE